MAARKPKATATRKPAPRSKRASPTPRAGRAATAGKATGARATPRAAEEIIDAAPLAVRERTPAEPVEEADAADGPAAELTFTDPVAALESEDAGAEPAPAELEHVDEAALVVPAPRSLGRGSDAMSSYMAEVHRHPLLTREEETALARRFRDTGDLTAAYRLVSSNLRLVVKLAHEYHRNPLALLDLVQEGNIGLMQAVKKFDPERGVKLSSYAAWWIRAYILRYIMDNWKMVKLGTTEAQRKLFFKLRQEQDRLVALGVEATPKLLAERLNVTEQDVVEMDQRLGRDEVSIDAPLSPDDDRANRADRLLPVAPVGAEEVYGDEELRKLFREKLSDFSASLSDKERFIFEKRLIADEPMTLQDIGAHYGVSRERARQIEASLVNRMRQYMREHIPDFDLVSEP